MKKKILIILFMCLFITGCKKEEDITTISYKQLVFEYGDEIKYSDIIDITDGEIIEDKLIDYRDAGDYEILIPYKNNIGRKKEYKVIIYLNDVTPPLVSYPSSLSTVKGNDIDFCKKGFYADNADRKIDCKVEGKYDVDKTGSYNLNVTFTDDFNNSVKRNVTLYVINKSSASNDEPQIIEDPIDDMIKKFKTDKTEIGIDVSSFQGDIDWNKVKDSGVEFAIIRLGYGHTSKNELMLDNQFLNNIKGAKEVGIKVGVYFFSYATEFYEVDEQTNFILNNLKDYELDLPIAFDFESWGGFSGYNINILDMNKVYMRFRDILESHGYKVMNYGSKYYLNNVWYSEKYTTWLAHYGYSTNYDKNYYIWQFTDTGLVPGIKGYVDLNILYK